MQETREVLVQSLGWQEHLEEKMATSPLPGKVHGQRSLAGLGPWDSKESAVTEHALRPAPHTQCFVFIEVQ